MGRTASPAAGTGLHERLEHAVKSVAGTILGTFGTYLRDRLNPTPQAMKLIPNPKKQRSTFFVLPSLSSIAAI